jgi:adenosine deaminase
VQSALGLGRTDIARLARNSFEASFLAAAQKQAWVAKVDAFAASHAR